jgi:hypothetical protein
MLISWWNIEGFQTISKGDLGIEHLREWKIHQHFWTFCEGFSIEREREFSIYEQYENLLINWILFLEIYHHLIPNLFQNAHEWCHTKELKRKKEIFFDVVVEVYKQFLEKI